MNGVSSALKQVDDLVNLIDLREKPRATVVLCPPATLLAAVSDHIADTGLLTGGQDCHPDTAGPHTGDISAPMLADAGARFVIVGHSERRTDHGETDELVCRKASAALGAGLIPIVCVGETQAERASGAAWTRVAGQLAASVPAFTGPEEIIVAYEPLWAIGSGTTPTADEIGDMHARMRGALAERFGERGVAVPLLYGGSLKPSNAQSILAIPDVNGGLVGRASLLSRTFYGIISAL
jgi:triosephosphate isomerase (TIM)